MSNHFDRPTLWIFAGPNGSGKSTVYSDAFLQDFDGSIWIINPDLLTTEIKEMEGLEQQAANLAAVQRIEAWLHASLGVRRSVGVETVLSTPKYRKLVEKARNLGFSVRLVYVVLKSAELQMERIRIRVAKGGHDVPEDKVFGRRKRSFEQLQWFLDQADRVDMFDNSGAAPRRIGEKQDDGTIIVDPSAPGDLIEALQAGTD
ncbi:AAA family ATPase [Tardibacter chloracetimidivorans]|uniref:AAA family ATPase n=1 Tax=Tardibacter chloracetimidivorans TaxID=1921510 RepID=UPI000ACA730E|nr:AAA family ATPase [Tardibacter chloracetimidivorans]